MLERRARLDVCVWGVVGDMRGAHTHMHTHTHTQHGGGAVALKGLRTKRRARGGDSEENRRLNLLTLWRKQAAAADSH